MTKKSILIINQSAPYSKGNAKESLDIALSAGTFEQSVSILFTGDACYQLIADQTPETIHSKNLVNMFKALPIYGIETLLVDEQSLHDRNITRLDDSLPITFVSKREVRKLYQNASTVLRF
jgi:tRNA 2-thiouridine synthesizing protein C